LLAVAECDILDTFLDRPLVVAILFFTVFFGFGRTDDQYLGKNRSYYKRIFSNVEHVRPVLTSSPI